MHGLDGNYIKMQGELLARMQVAYQSEQTAQQTRAQAQNLEALRQLREQVDVTAKTDAQNRFPLVNEKREGGSSGDGKRATKQVRYGPAGETETDPDPSLDPRGRGHVDVRI